MKQRLTFFLRFSGIPFLIRLLLQRNRTTILYYHDIAPGLLDKHLAYLKKRYEIIGLQDYLHPGRQPAKRTLVITLDDGHKGNAALLPVLEKHRVPVTIFLVSGVAGTTREFWFKLPDLSSAAKEKLKKMPNAERLDFLSHRCGYAPERETGTEHALSRRDLESLKPWVDFQSHTVTHPCLDQCTESESRHEIGQSRLDLAALLGTEVNAIAFPNGDFTGREERLSKEAGYTCVLSAENGFNPAVFTESSYVLKRISINDRNTIHELAVRACGLWGWLKKTKTPC